MNNISSSRAPYFSQRNVIRGLMTLALLFVFWGIQAQSNTQFFLRGEIKGLDSGKVYLYYRDDQNRGKLDSSVVKDGRFFLKGAIAEPCMAFITLKSLAEGPDIGSLNSGEIYLEPTLMYLSAAVNKFNEIILKGSATDKDRMRLRKLRAPITAIIAPVQERMSAIALLYKKDKKDSAVVLKKELKHEIDSLSSRLTSLYKEKDAVDSLFMIRHLHSYFTANILLRKVQAGTIGFTYASALLHSFPEKLKRSFVGTELSRKLTKVKLIPLGGETSNFVAINTTGDTISLRKYRGRKYVLLDFWASWCVPCRRLTPDLKAIYQQYRDHLEIIGISFDARQTDLRKAMVQDSIEWPQIMQNDQHVRIDPVDKLISDRFFVDGFPFLLLIDKEGKLVKKFGSGVDAVPAYQITSEISKLIH
ncbi:TlpA disulfide reductase family protein [Chitinophaga eiseniae]|uniref:AhpC/TSA family protein n=1 Tax=Chitinophaga eiseniae TaxID=634771 RepID=A0A847ST93_9BACT|nr:TlpA disulfide reductase family protein [Chitinophaga eiseniae]NLR82387.1 AhpC/TSA family protein [Chitinophaga eiseniae]